LLLAIKYASKVRLESTTVAANTVGAVDPAQAVKPTVIHLQHHRAGKAALENKIKLNSHVKDKATAFYFFSFTLWNPDRKINPIQIKKLFTSK